jgi:hypothetical protein
LIRWTCVWEGGLGLLGIISAAKDCPRRLFLLFTAVTKTPFWTPYKKVERHKSAIVVLSRLLRGKSIKQHIRS